MSVLISDGNVDASTCPLAARAGRPHRVPIEHSVDSD